MTDIAVRLQGLESLIARVSLEKMLEDNSTYSYTVYYEKDMTNRLAELCDHYGSDKGEIRTSGHPYPWPSHNYADFLHSRFWHCRDAVRTVFECGLGTNNPDLASSMGATGKPGASLRVWRDYFPNARIFGADIDKSILFEEERIRTYHVDQTSKASIEAMWKQIPAFAFDLMIDDGLHQFEAGICLFENSISRLAKTGHYIIEDVTAYDMLRYRSYFAGKSFKVEYVSLRRPSNTSDGNQLVVIRP
jgi:hypothetical protein